MDFIEYKFGILIEMWRLVLLLSVSATRNITYFCANFSLSSSSLLSLRTVQSSDSEAGCCWVCACAGWPWLDPTPTLARDPLESEAWMWFIFFSTASNVFLDISRCFLVLVVELPRVL